ncbi:conserved Plasmodium protein, unknown function [Plasmodium ovale]|uniref:Uncharacterized protein n=1 Tax=Plasmodium ovale TaxID=36330 RepID=A0A1C3KTU1_PLAOA|nr:conserved Plasmodium protein, unknown function [Plasmodium ovale]
MNIQENRAKLKSSCEKHVVGDVSCISMYGEDKDKEKKNELHEKGKNYLRKSKLLALSKGLNIANVSKLREVILYEKEEKKKSRLKKKIITDSSCDEDGDYNTGKETHVGGETGCKRGRVYTENEVPYLDKEHMDLLQLNSEISGPTTTCKINDVVQGSQGALPNSIKNDDDGAGGSDMGSGRGIDMGSDLDSGRRIEKESISPEEQGKNFNSPHPNNASIINLFSDRDSSEYGADESKDKPSDSDREGVERGKKDGSKAGKRNDTSVRSKKGNRSHDSNSSHCDLTDDDTGYDNSTNFYCDDYGDSYDVESDVDNNSDEYTLHLKLFNEQNLGNDNFQLNSLSVRKSLRLYIEFIVLSLLSPNLKYDADYFKASESIRKTERLLKENYAYIHRQLWRKNSLQECYNCSDESEDALIGKEAGGEKRAKKKEVKKRKKNLKKLCEHTSESESGEEQNTCEQSDTSNKSLTQSLPKKRQRQKQKQKRYVLSDSSSCASSKSGGKKGGQPSDQNSENDVMVTGERRGRGEKSANFEMSEEDRMGGKQTCAVKAHASLLDTHDGDGSVSGNGSVCAENREESADSTQEDDVVEDNDEADDEHFYLGDRALCPDEAEFHLEYGKGKRKKRLKEISDDTMHKILSSDMVKVYEFVKKEEKYSNYDFLKMICKMSKQKSINYYDQCIQKIENKILSKRDQFESHPFETNFKNILKNYANIFLFFLEYNKIYCSCCNRKLNYACPVFFIKPFYNSSDLWKNYFFNFMKVNNYQWLGYIHFNTFPIPLQIINNRIEDEKKMNKIRASNKLFIRNQNEKKKKNLLLPINNFNNDRYTILNNEKYILSHLKKNEELNGYRYIGRIEGKRLNRIRKCFKTNYDFEFITNECRENNINMIMKNVCENFCTLSENYIEKDILVLQLGSYCVSTVYYWHVFHHYKFFFTKFIYIKLLALYKKNKDLFREPLLLAYILSKKFNRELYHDFKILMNIDISQIQNNLNESDLFLR